MTMGVGRIIETPECVAEGMAYLAHVEPRFAQVAALTGSWPVRRAPDGFAELVRAIVAQQVSVASARAITARVAEAGFMEPQTVRAASDDALRAVGLSRAKQRYLRALAEAEIDYIALRTKPDDEVIATLVKVPGIGIWTAEIYTKFALGRADVFAAGDLALQVAAQHLFALDHRPTQGQLRAMAEPWRPWRSIAARGLWAYHHHIKGREGVT